MVGGVSGISAVMVHMLSLTGLGVGSVRTADTCLRGVVQGNSVLSGAPELIVDVESCGGGVIVKWFSSRCITVSLSIVVVVGVWEVGIHAASVHTSDSIVLLALSWVLGSRDSRYSIDWWGYDLINVVVCGDKICLRVFIVVVDVCRIVRAKVAITAKNIFHCFLYV